jgi:hypothetical protein
MAHGQKKRRKRSIEASTEIDGFALHWELRSEPQLSSEHGNEGLSILVRRTDGAFRELILEYPIAMQERFGMTMPKYFPQRPKISARLVDDDIRQAMADGRDPASRGKYYTFLVANSHE